MVFHEKLFIYTWKK